jgi:hypothetical protein
MNTPILIGVAVVTILVGLFVSLSSIQQILRIRRTPTSHISDLPSEGEVEICGKAGPAVTKSPISQSDCVLWRAEIQNRQSSGKESRWVTIYKEISNESFEIIDETGKVIVQPSIVELTLHKDINQSSGLFNSLDEETKAAVETLGVETTGLLGMDNSLKVEESCIFPGDAIYILGQVIIEDGLKKIVSDDTNSLIISDRSEKELLGALYKKVVIRLLVIPIGVILLMSILIK